MGGTGHWPVPSGDPPDGTGEALFLPADTIRHWCFVILSSFNIRHSSFVIPKLKLSKIPEISLFTL